MFRRAHPPPGRPFAGKVTLVTGGNTGVGYEYAAVMARGGATVVLACRNRARGTAAVAALRREVVAAAEVAAPPPNGTTGGGGGGGSGGGGWGTVELLDLDTSDLASVSACAAAFSARHNRLDILMNNAGGMMLPWSLTRDGVEVTTATNFLGHFALTARLWGLLAATPGARVVNVSSMVHVLATRVDWDDMALGPRGHSSWSYVRSKLFNMLFTAELARRVAAADAAAGRGPPHPPSVVAVSAQPGFARTNLVAKAQVNAWTNFCRATWGWASHSAADGAACLVAAATAPWVSPSTYVSPLWGGIRGRPSRGVPSLPARSVDGGGRLWAWAEGVSGLRLL